MKPILLLAAIICFVLAVFGIDVGRIELVPLGLMFFAASFLLSGPTA